MGDSELRQRTGPSHSAGGPVFDLIAAKLYRPLLRPGTVRRSSLIERLARGDRRPITSVVAPAGYGKTTVLAPGAEGHGQALPRVGWSQSASGYSMPSLPPAAQYPARSSRGSARLSHRWPRPWRLS